MGVALAPKGYGSRAPLVYACAGKHANEKQGRRIVRGIKMNGIHDESSYSNEFN